MALVKAIDLVGGLTSKIRLPRNRYTGRCIKDDFGNSKGSGNPMVTRVFEIALPETVLINGQQILIAGTEVIQYLPIIVLEEGVKNKEKTDKAQAKFSAENVKLGLPEDFDDENPLAEGNAVGKVVAMILSSEEYSPRLDLTPEEKAKGLKVGQPIKDENGKDIVSYRVKLEQVLGLSSADVPGF